MRKSLKKQLITTVLSMGIVISLLSGCGDQKETKSTTKKADVTQSADQEAKDPVNTGQQAIPLCWKRKPVRCETSHHSS